jgi:hypothetical protein
LKFEILDFGLRGAGIWQGLLARRFSIENLKSQIYF